MSFLRKSRQKATSFARGDKRVYTPGWGGIPPEDWFWGATPDPYSPDEFEEYLIESNSVYSVTDQRANYLGFLPLRLYKQTGDPGVMEIPRSAGEALLQKIQQQMNGRLPNRELARRAIFGLAASSMGGEGKIRNYIRSHGLEEITSGPAYELLHRVNDFWTMHRLIRMTSLARDIWGQSYWVIERGESTLGEPQEIWWVKPTQMRPIPHPELYISHYEFDPLGGGDPIPFLPWEVVRIYNPNPLDEFKALSALSSTSIFADHEKDSMEANMNLHRMGLNPGAIVTPTKGMLWEAGQAREIEEEINKRLGGVEKAHRWGTFRQEVDIHKTAVTPRDSEFLGGMSYDLEAVARAYDWPIDLLAGKRTYENVEMAFKRAWQTTVMSAAAFSADIAEFYLPMFGESEILVPFFDASNIAVLQETETVKWEREHSQIDVVITRNEWRQGRGLQPKEGGDELYIPVNAIPISQADKLGQVPTAPTEIVEEEEEELVTVGGNGSGPDSV
jgi:hypothetical protein